MSMRSVPAAPAPAPAPTPAPTLAAVPQPVGPTTPVFNAEQLAVVQQLLSSLSTPK
jgi:hypothetical protein